MATPKKGSEPAFPLVIHDGLTSMTVEHGLTKREAFAMAAMQGFVSDHVQLNVVAGGGATKSEMCTLIANFAVMCADALLEELAK
jgi:pyrroline-5-carboxylate reductase